MMGRWRVEVTPGEARADDVFLHVIQVGDRELESMDDLELIEAEGSCGVRLKTAEETWEVAFRSQGDLGGRIKRTGQSPTIDAELSTAVTPQTGITVEP